MIEINKDCICFRTKNHFYLFYLWYGIVPFWECSGIKERSFEIGFGYWSKELFRYAITEKHST